MLEEYKQVQILKVNYCPTATEMTFPTAFDVMTINNDLQTFKSIVNGSIEIFRLCSSRNNNIRKTLDLICNDVGKLERMPYRCVIEFMPDTNDYDIIHGECFITATNRTNCENVPLTDYDIKFLSDRIKYCVLKNNNTKERFYLPVINLNDLSDYNPTEM